MMDDGKFESINTPQKVHNELRKVICIEYLPTFPAEGQRAFKIFRDNCREYLSYDQQRFNDPHDIFDALEEKGKIGVGEYEILKDIVSDVNTKILALIKLAEQRIDQIRGATDSEVSNTMQSLQGVSLLESTFGIVQNERRILIIGKSGVGKSETGNRILGRPEFETDASDESVTCVTSFGEAYRNDKRIMVVDTPGLFDTNRTNEETISEIMKCHGITAPGLHAILLLLGIERMTDEQKTTIEIFQERFGKENFDRFLIVVFTGKEKLTCAGKTINGWVENLKPDSNLKKLLNSINNRYVALGLMSSSEERENEISCLMDMIENVFEENGGQCYTNEMYRQADRVLQDRLAYVQMFEKEKHTREMEEAMAPLQAELEEKERELEKRKDKKDNLWDKVDKEWIRFKKRGYKISW